MELKNYFAQDTEGNILSEATCYLYMRGTESLAEGLLRANGVPLANPFAADSFGLIQFAAPNGLYDLRVVKGSRDYRLGVQFHNVEENIAEAQAAAERAELARDAAQLSAGLKDDIAQGLATTLSGQYFSVPSPESSEYLILYKNNAGVATPIDEYPNSAALTAAVSDSAANALAAGDSEAAAALSSTSSSDAALSSGIARAAAEKAAAASAASAKSAAAVVTGGTATLDPTPGKLPLADGDGKIDAEWMPANIARSADLATKTDGTKGAAKIGHHGQNLSVSLQNLNGAAGLKRFVQRLSDNANEKRINTRLVGTSIATLNSASSVFAQALASYFGESKSQVNVFANQAQNPINGWKAQYYSGTYSTRLRGGNGDGAAPIVIQRRAKSITLFYGKEVDGGSVGVSIQTANQATVVQAPIDCSGGTAINVPVTYELDPNFTSTITITPPAAGFGYLEYYISDAGDYGMTFFNSAYGGSALWNHTGDGPLGMVAREASPGMYPSAVPSGTLGLAATFAPTNEQAKPALLIYSGPTNDAGNKDKYASQLLSAVTLAVNNGSACILVIEPLNGSTSRATWDALRAAYYSAADAFPDSVFVYDFDAFLSWDLSFNQKFHNPSLSDPHPGDYGYGSPHTAAGYDLCQRMGVPFQRKLGRVAAPDFGRVYTQPNEPLQAVPDAVWIDTSNSVAGVRKTLISRGQGWGARGLWACDTGENKVVSFYGQDFLIAAPMAFGSRAAGKNFLGDPCAVFTGQSGFDLDSSKFIPGKTYTLSYLYETAAAVLFNTCFTFGVNPFLTVKVAQQAFILSGSSNVSAVNSPGGYGDIKRLVLTFKWPTLDEQAAATAAGVAMNLLRFTVQGGSVANPISVWAFRIEEGSSVTLATKPIVNLATTQQLGATVSSIEPLSTVVSEGGAWSDTSNTAAVSKRMIQKDVLANIAAAAPGIFGAGVSLWRGPAPAVNLMDSFINNATLTVDSGGSVVTKGTFGPGNKPGIRWDMGTDITNSQIKIQAPPDSMNLVPGAIYTLSYLVRCGRGDMALEPTASMGIYNGVGYIALPGTTTSGLTSDLVTWSTAAPAFKVLSCPRDQKYVRAKMTFKAYPGLVAGNAFRLVLLSLNQVSQWAELSDFRLELGASVTAD